MKQIKARMAPLIISMEKEFAIIFSAFFSSPEPLAIEKSGAPPMPNKLANAVIIVMIGRVSPIPVKASVEV